MSDESRKSENDEEEEGQNDTIDHAEGEEQLILSINAAAAAAADNEVSTASMDHAQQDSSSTPSVIDGAVSNNAVTREEAKLLSHAPAVDSSQHKIASSCTTITSRGGATTSSTKTTRGARNEATSSQVSPGRKTSSRRFDSTKFGRRQEQSTQSSQITQVESDRSHKRMKEELQHASERLQDFSCRLRGVGAFRVAGVGEQQQDTADDEDIVFDPSQVSDPSERSTSQAVIISEAESTTAAHHPPILLEANVVMDDSRVPQSAVADVERAVRERLIREATLANVVGQEEHPEEHSDVTKASTKKRRQVIVGLVVVAIVVGSVVALSVYFTQGSSSSNAAPNENNIIDDNDPNSSSNVTSPSLSTLATVLERGRVRCGVYGDAFGFAVPNETTGRVEGFSADLCRGVSAVVFGDSKHVEFIVATSANRFQLLEDGVVDLISQTTTHTMERDVVERTTGEAFNFAIPFLYSGLGFGGIPEYVDCAERLDPLFDECRNLVICVGKGTTQELVLNDLLPGPAVISQSTAQEMFANFSTGECNVLAADPINMAPVRMRALGWTGPFKLGTRLFSRDPLCIMTTERDSEWSGLVNLVMNIVISGEAQNITQASANDWREEQAALGIINETLVHQISNVLSAVGNLGELYERHLELVIPRTGLNLLNDGSNQSAASGLLYSQPYGDLMGAEGSAPITGGTLKTVSQRGRLRCGVVVEPGFAEFDELSVSWSGFYVEYCNALSAAIFLGDPQTVFVELESQEVGFSAVENRSIDVFAGGELTLSTFQGFEFSPPIFYDSMGGASALVSGADDRQWPDFVYWVVMATIQAEESMISVENAIKMPVINLYGEQFKQMFRDCIHAVGNYGDIYNRTLEATVPRAGRNRLNVNLDTAQHYPVPFA